ncbi:hypothetical protein ACFL2R_02065 [Patescibacteria group bacterium]
MSDDLIEALKEVARNCSDKDGKIDAKRMLNFLETKAREKRAYRAKHRMPPGAE